MATYYLVKGDDAPQVRVILKRDVSNEIIDLSAATVVFKFRKKGTESLFATLTSVASPDDAVLGIAVFEWGLTDLDISAGNYEAEIEITYSNGKVETVYEVIDFVLRGDF